MTLINAETTLNEALEEIWGLLRRALADKKHPFRFATLATKGVDAPGLRYVVLRDMDEDGALYIFTDSRSAKVKEMQVHPGVSLLFYHPGLRCQLKVSGQVSLHQGDDVAMRYWSLIQDEARKAYGSVLSPGCPVEHPADAYEWPGVIENDHFLVIRIAPTRLEL